MLWLLLPLLMTIQAAWAEGYWEYRTTTYGRQMNTPGPKADIRGHFQGNGVLVKTSFEDAESRKCHTSFLASWNLSKTSQWLVPGEEREIVVNTDASGENWPYPFGGASIWINDTGKILEHSRSKPAGPEKEKATLKVPSGSTDGNHTLKIGFYAVCDGEMNIVHHYEWIEGSPPSTPAPEAKSPAHPDVGHIPDPAAAATPQATTGTAPSTPPVVVAPTGNHPSRVPIQSGWQNGEWTSLVVKVRDGSESGFARSSLAEASYHYGPISASKQPEQHPAGTTGMRTQIFERWSDPAWSAVVLKLKDGKEVVYLRHQLWGLFYHREAKAGPRLPDVPPTPRTTGLSGKWKGTWQNSLGESGIDTLELREDEKGSLTGTWSGTIAVAGAKSADGTMTLRGRTAARDYQISGRLGGQTLQLTYTVRRLDGNGSYTGKSELNLTPQ